MRKRLIPIFVGLISCFAMSGWTYAANTSPDGNEEKAQHEGKVRRALPGLINTRLSLGVFLSEKQEKDLTETDKEILSMCTVPGVCQSPISRVAGLLLNIFLPFALGSWIVGDYAGGFIGLFGQAGGVALMLIAQFLLEGFLAPAGVALWIIGISLAGIGYVVPLFTVLFFQHGDSGLAQRPVTPDEDDYFTRAMNTKTVPMFRGTF